MPNKDGTGPEGKGPATGRGRGNCRCAENPGTTKGLCGRGRMGRRFGSKNNANE